MAGRNLYHSSRFTTCAAEAVALAGSMGSSCWEAVKQHHLSPPYLQQPTCHMMWACATATYSMLDISHLFCCRVADGSMTVEDAKRLNRGHYKRFYGKPMPKEMFF